MIFFVFFAVVFQMWFGAWTSGGQQVFADVVRVAPASKTIQVTVPGSSTPFTVELARTPAELEKGLMYRTRMAQDRGMLFVFPDEVPRTFWMKNTLIPLDMIFTTKDGTIVKIWHNVPPCKTPICPTYSSTQSATYVLEISGGLSQTMLLKEGDGISISGL